MYCSRCGAEVEGQSKFCGSCGQDLMATTPVAAVEAGERTDQAIVSEALAGEYEIIEELGRGGMALVYRAQESQLERDVAVKVLPFALAFDAEFVERFQREARTAAQLEHPNIIPVYRVGRAGRVTYFVMKYLRGGSLSGLLGKRGRLPAPEIRRLLIDCASALAYAHQRGIVHRDMKPDNVMFDEFGQLHVTDFGIAKAMSAGKLTGTGMSIGTPHYMSPEQARALAIDGRSDIYSLGVVAFQCLTGRVPFDGEDSFAIGYQHITEPLPQPQLHNPDDRKLYETIRRMTMKDPVDRPQDCAELITLLQHQPVAPAGSLTSGSAAAAPPLVVTPSHARPTTPIGPSRALQTPRSGSRRVPAQPEPARRAGGGVLAILLVLALGGGGGWWYATQHADASESAQPADALAAPSGGVDTAAVGAAEGHDAALDEGAGPATAGAAAPDSALQPAAESSPAGTATAAPIAAVPTALAPAAALSPRDSGSLKVVGLPAGSSVLLDGEPVHSAVTRLPAGRHIVAISAPLHNFYEEQIEVVADDLYELEPVLVKQGLAAPASVRRGVKQRRLAAAGLLPTTCAEPGPTYNADRSCYDVRPRPVEAARVPLPSTLKGAPSPSTVLVKVSAEGHPLEVKALRPSSDLEFERLARDYAATTAWKPATLAGQAVEGWTTWTVVGVRMPVATPAPNPAAGTPN
jgi:serine/threonine protein kinase